MSAEKVIYNLLSTDTALLTVVPKTRIYAGVIPLDAILPAICYNLVSSRNHTTIGLTTMKSRSRVQITLAAKSYPSVKTLAPLVDNACNNKRGTFNGIVTDSVIMDDIGADFRDDETGVYYSTLDFAIVHNR